LVTVVPCLLGSSLVDAQHLPHGRRQAGDRHLKFHETRDNLDPVAVTHYALSSVRGEAGAAWWAASRAMDQAFDGVEYPKDVVAFLPVEADAQSREVPAEIARQIRLLQAAESAPDLAAAISRLRP
jgi:hypothetical protein